MLDKGVNACNRAMSAVSYNGQVCIVRLMFECAANNFNVTMNATAERGHEPIVRLIRDRMNLRYPSLMSLDMLEESDSESEDTFINII